MVERERCAIPHARSLEQGDMAAQNPPGHGEGRHRFANLHVDPHAWHDTPVGLNERSTL